jgi:hypothetical protein
MEQVQFSKLQLITYTTNSAPLLAAVWRTRAHMYTEAVHFAHLTMICAILSIYSDLLSSC